MLFYKTIRVLVGNLPTGTTRKADNVSMWRVYKTHVLRAHQMQGLDDRFGSNTV